MRKYNLNITRKMTFDFTNAACNICYTYRDERAHSQSLVSLYFGSVLNTESRQKKKQ